MTNGKSGIIASVHQISQVLSTDMIIWSKPFHLNATKKTLESRTFWLGGARTIFAMGNPIKQKFKSRTIFIKWFFKGTLVDPGICYEHAP